MTQIVGGRNVVFHSSICIAIPMILTAIALRTPDTRFTTLIIAAWLSGIGGGAFASSMSNISFFYPKRMQGYSLGMNAGLGNFGVSVTQLLMPIFMSLSFGKDPLSPFVDGWPNHAGWFWWPTALVCAVGCYVWMSNLPNHGVHPDINKNAKWRNFIYFYWMETVALGAAFVAVITLVTTRDAVIWNKSTGGKVWYNIIMVLFATALGHLGLYYLSPRAPQEKLDEQYQMFRDKHTYVMTFLYIMCFGSFIGFSSAFPKLITDVFGYVTAGGCYYGDNFVEGGTEYDCVANGGEWGYETVTNPNAPNVFAYTWFGPAVGSLIRPFGGILADSHGRYIFEMSFCFAFFSQLSFDLTFLDFTLFTFGFGLAGGAKITQILIVWCTVATVSLGFLIQKTAERVDHPENNFGLFVFLFLNIFFCVGAMNGTTFRTIGVLFDEKLAGPVLGWSSAIASYGAFILPAMFGVAFSVDKPETTFYFMAGYYVICGFVNFYFYTRPGAERPGV